MTNRNLTKEFETILLIDERGKKSSCLKNYMKKYLIECRVPVENRDRLVVAAVGSEIVWIPDIANARWLPEEEKNSRKQGWLFINIK